MNQLVACPDCGARLAPFDGPTHRYIGGSPACWHLFSLLNNAGEPPLAHSLYNTLLVDAYAAQHHGRPSPQAIQSVAVHLLALHGVLGKGRSSGEALQIRIEALAGDKKGRFVWLEPPPRLVQTITLADVVSGETAVVRTQILGQYVQAVYDIWLADHGRVIDNWYSQYLT